jgi:hypothetical protein
MKSKKTTVAAGILGTAVGVAAGVATVYLSDKKNRKTALKKAKELHLQAEETLDELSKKARMLGDKVEEMKSQLRTEEEETEEVTKKE